MYKTKRVAWHKHLKKAKKAKDKARAARQPQAAQSRPASARRPT